MGTGHLSLHSFCQASLSEGVGRGAELGACPVSPECEARTCSQFGLKGALRIPRGLVGLLLSWSQALDFSWERSREPNVLLNGRKAARCV